MQAATMKLPPLLVRAFVLTMEALPQVRSEAGSQQDSPLVQSQVPEYSAIWTLVAMFGNNVLVAPAATQAQPASPPPTEMET